MIEAILLGLIQGITEFIPVSSSGHLVIIPELLKLNAESTSFDVFIHGGTLLSLLIAYRKRIWNILTTLKEKSTQNLSINVIIATIPAAIVGFLYQKFLDEQLKSVYLTAAMLAIIGIIFILTDFWLKQKPTLKESKENSVKKAKISFKSYEKLNWKNAAIIGLMQPLAFLRGTSRSGITILAGVSQKMDLKNAVDFSFLMSIPIIAGAFVFETLSIIKDGAGGESGLHLTVGFVTAFISGLIAINFMLKFVNKMGLKWFGVYRLALSLLIIIWALSK
jgi:undecaprenyl-diphosphatase